MYRGVQVPRLPFNIEDLGVLGPFPADFGGNTVDFSRPLYITITGILTTSAPFVLAHFVHAL